MLFSESLRRAVDTLVKMGRERSRSTKPFEPAEAARLAAATRKNAEHRPTSKLSRDELLGLISRSARPPSHDGSYETIAIAPEIAQATEPMVDAQRSEGLGKPAPGSEPAATPATADVVPLETPTTSIARDEGERRPRHALRALTAPEHFGGEGRRSSRLASAPPVTTGFNLALFVAVAFVISALLATLVFASSS